MITEGIKVVKELCLYCGACAEVCPAAAIKLIEQKSGFYIPSIEEEKCRRCSLCSNVCPAEPFDFSKYLYKNSEDQVFGPEGHKNCYLALHSQDDVRYAASSGGVVRGILKHVLRNRLVSGVAAVGENHEHPLKPEFRIFRDERHLGSLASSKYAPVRLNGIIKKIISDNSLEKIIFVGLPCQVRAIRKAALMIPGLKNKQITAIGLFCKKNKDIRFSKYLFLRLTRDIDSQFRDVEYVRYRGNGWPGETVFRVNGREYRESNKSHAVYSFPWKWHLFSPESCLFCYDPFARSADLSVGDPWLKKYQESGQYDKGASFLIVRNNRAQALIEGCPEIIKQSTAVADVYQSQSPEEINSKLRNARARLKIMLRNSPVINSRASFFNGVSFMEMINAHWFLSVKRLFELMFERKFFASLPGLFFRILAKLPKKIM